MSSAINPCKCDTTEFKPISQPHFTSNKVYMAVSAIFIAAGIATIAYCAAIHNVHVFTGLGASAVGFALFIPSIYTLSQHDPIDTLTLQQGEKMALNDVELAAIEVKKGVMTHYQLSVDSFDIQDFENWLLKHADEHKSAVLKALMPPVTTLNKNKVSIDFYLFNQTCSLEGTKSTDFSQVGYVEDNYDYSDEGRSYIDFANPHTFGGGWRSSGQGQEERIFEKAPKLALLAYLSAKAKISIAPRSGVAIVIPNVELLDVDAPPVTITAIAAKFWTKKGSFYSNHDLNHHFQASYRACIAEKKLNPNNPTIHTGDWGCGEFNGSLYINTTLQLYAAQMAGVTINFHNIDEQAVSAAQQLADENDTPRQLFRAIRNLKADPTWRAQALDESIISDYGA